MTSKPGSKTSKKKKIKCKSVFQDGIAFGDKEIDLSEITPDDWREITTLCAELEKDLYEGGDPQKCLIGSFMVYLIYRTDRNTGPVSEGDVH